MSHFQRDERYTSFFAPSIYSEGVTSTYGDTTGVAFTGWGGEGRKLFLDAKKQVKAAENSVAWVGYQKANIDSHLMDMSTEGVLTGSVSNLSAFLQAAIAFSWASRALPPGVQSREALRLAQEYLEKGSCNLCLVRTDTNLIADINSAVGNTLLDLSNEAGQPVRQGALSWLLSKYGVQAARAAGGSISTFVDPEQIAEEQELARQRSLLGQGVDAAGKSAGDVACGAEVLRGLFTGKKPLSCDPQGNLYKNWMMYKWAFRIGGGLLLVGLVGNTLKPYVEILRKDR